MIDLNSEKPIYIEIMDRPNYRFSDLDNVIAIRSQETGSLDSLIFTSKKLVESVKAKIGSYV